LPDKAIDLMDEAASRVRLAVFNLPPDLRDVQTHLEELEKQMEEASDEKDYETAARIKAERAELEEEFEQKRSEWFATHSIDESVDEEDIAEVVAKWTGIPVKRMVQEEMARLLDMENEL